MKLNESPLIAQSVVVGQDQRFLGALIVVDEAELQNCALREGLSHLSTQELCAHETIRKVYEGQISELINSEHGFKLFERIHRFALLSKPFEVGVELSAKQDMMRHKIASLYRKEIDQLFVKD